MDRRVRGLELEAMKIAVEIQNWIRSRDRIDVYLNFNRADQLKLLKLRTWEQVYKVSLFEIMDIIVEPIRVHSNLRRRRYGLGTSVASLTGYHAERILATIIGRKYPAGENVGLWREAERDRQMRAEKIDELDGMEPREEKRQGILRMVLVDSFVENYVRSVIQRRDKMIAESGARWRRRKAYRDNPWRM